MVRLYLVFFMGLIIFACSKDVDRYKPKSLVDIDNQFGIKKLWETDIGKETFDKTTQLVPVYADGKIFTADNFGRVSAINPDNGDIIWQVKLDVLIGGGPAVSNGQVIVGTQKGEVISLDATQGKIQWRTQSSSEIIASPAIGEGYVVSVSVDGKIVALDAKTGKQKWFYDQTLPRLTLRGTSSPVIIDGGVFAGFSNGKLAVFILENGLPAWDKTITAPVGRTEIQKLVDVDIRPLIVGSDLYVASVSGNLMNINASSSDGEVIWQRELSTFQDMTASELLLLVTHENSYVSAVDRSNGRVLWTQKDLYQRSLSPPVAIGEYVIVSDFKGYLHWLLRKDGSMVSRHHLDSSGISAMPLVIGDKIILQSHSGSLYAVQKK